MSAQAITRISSNDYRFAVSKATVVFEGFECLIKRAGTRGAYEGLARNITTDIAIRTERIFGKGAKAEVTKQLQGVVRQLLPHMYETPVLSVRSGERDAHSQAYFISDSRSPILQVVVRARLIKILCINCNSHDCEHVSRANEVATTPACECCCSSRCVHALAVAEFQKNQKEISAEISRNLA